MSDTLTQQKQNLRRRMQRQRRLIPPQEKRRVDHAIAQRLCQTDAFRRSKRIFLYYSTPEEIDTHEIMTCALAHKKTVCVPKCLPKRQMEARRICGEADLTEQTYGIPEPGAQCPVVAPEELDLIVVPALCCDESGRRLGYGGGFYDRYLRHAPGVKAVLCTADRMLEHVPADALDQRCDLIITENEVIHPSEK